MIKSSRLVIFMAAAFLIAWLIPWQSAVAEQRINLNLAKDIRFHPESDFNPKLSGEKPKSLSLRLYGGYSHFAAKDLNEGLDGYFELMEIYKAEGAFSSVTGGYKPLHPGYNLGADLIYQITSKIGLGLGLGYLRSSKVSRLDFETTYGDTGKLRSSSSLSAIPIRLGVFLTWPMKNKLNFIANAGLSYYAGLKLNTNNRLESGTGYWLEGSIKASGGSISRNLGFHGSLGLEYWLSSKIGFYAEAIGRYARFKNFSQATSLNRDSGGDSESIKGKLYLETYSSTAGTFSYFIVSDTPPISTPDEIFKEPKIDLSGFSLQAGFHIKF